MNVTRKLTKYMSFIGIMTIALLAVNCPGDDDNGGSASPPTPVFSGAPYDFSIEDRDYSTSAEGVGTVGTVTSSNTTRYVITVSSNDMLPISSFEISNGGVITTMADLSALLGQNTNLTVTAYNGASDIDPSATARVTTRVVDAPVFEAMSYTFNIEAGDYSTSAEEVGTVTASDATRYVITDSGDNANLPDGTFEISTMGTITAVANLSMLAGQNTNLTITAYNGANDTAPSATAMVMIRVGATSRPEPRPSTPAFTMASYGFSIEEGDYSATAGTVGTVTASGATRYVITASTNSILPIGSFAISNMGVITAIANLSAPQTTVLTITAYNGPDNDDPSATAMVTILVVATGTPIFTGAPYFFILDAGDYFATAGTVGTVTASDATRYEITGASFVTRPDRDNRVIVEPFAISTAGVITAIKDLSPIAPRNYTLTIVAYNGAQDTDPSATAMVTIFIADPACGRIDVLRDEARAAIDDTGGVLSSPITLDDVFVTYFDLDGFAGFAVQKTRGCPAIWVATGTSIHPVTNLELAIGDQISFEVTHVSEFSNFLQVNAQLSGQDLRLNEITKSSTGANVLNEVASTLVSGSLAEAHESRLVKSTATATVTSRAGTSLTVSFTLEGFAFIYTGRFNGLTDDLCDTGTFTFSPTKGAVIGQFNTTYQVTTYENDAIMVVTDGCPVPPDPTSPEEPVSAGPLVISEVGCNVGGISQNDYVVIYNRTNAEVDLTGFFIGRDSTCSTSGGAWTEYDPLSGTIAANGYFRIGRSGSSFTPASDQIWSGSVSTGYCFVIADSSTRPRVPDADNVIDWVTIAGTGTAGEGGTRAPTFTGGGSYVQRGGNCNHVDTNNNANDFVAVTAADEYVPKSTSAEACVPSP